MENSPFIIFSPSNSRSCKLTLMNPATICFVPSSSRCQAAEQFWKFPKLLRVLLQNVWGFYSHVILSKDRQNQHRHQNTKMFPITSLTCSPFLQEVPCCFCLTFPFLWIGEYHSKTPACNHPSVDLFYVGSRCRVKSIYWKWWLYWRVMSCFA